MVALAGLLVLPVGSGPALAATPGTPWTWGSNGFGELGDGTNANHFTAAPATGFAADAVELGGGREHVVARRADGTVWTWGSSQYGQLGSGSTANRSTPGQVAGLAGVTQIAAGHYHSMALLGDGTVRTWGMNGQGQLGDGTRTQRLRPVQVRNLTGVTQIAGARGHSLALRSDGSVWTWATTPSASSATAPSPTAPSR
jgi:alpha-tubulin suppressor-like RCC1 family protein